MPGWTRPAPGHSRRARRALAHLAEADPALAALALWCGHRDAPGPTAVSGETIRYGEGFEALALPQQVGLAAHHILHVALRHPARRADMAGRLGDRFRPDLFNLAADALVNEALILGGHAPPRPCPRASELAAAALGRAMTPEAALAEWDVETLYLALLPADGAAGRKAEAYGRARGFAPDIEPGDRAGAPAAPAAEWRGRVVRAFEAGRRAGTGVGRLGPMLAELAPARTPWEVELRRLVARAVADAPRRSWRRPAGQWVAREAEARRAGGPAPVFEPGRARDAPRPRIVVGLDSSGSVGDAALGLFAAEAAGIARRTGAETHVMAFDETVYLETRMGPGRWERAITGAEIRRGGGTSFVDLMARAAALAPSIVVVLTDLDGEFGPPPRAPVLWAAPAPPAAPPPYGRVLVMAG